MSKAFFTSVFLLFVFISTQSQDLFKAPLPSTHTRWVSPENPTGEKSKAGLINKGAKGSAFFTVKSGEQLVLLDAKGAGIINRIWMSGTIPRSAEQRRLIKIEMFWDGMTKPAVSVPIGDFFGVGLGLEAAFQNALFSNPEGRSFNCNIPMPFRKSAKIVITNESSAHALVWYDVDYTSMEKIPDDAMYFHAYWNRDIHTTIGEDYQIMPTVKGTGRFLGTNIGVVGDSAYRGTWFGEGEVKVFLDGDTKHPTLAGTGTEDYIGSGWGQGEYYNQYQGSLISDNKHDLYAFYRYHIADPVYFHSDCNVTIQQIGNTSIQNMRTMLKNGVKMKPVWVFKQGDATDIFNLKGKVPDQIALLDRADIKSIEDKQFDAGNFGGNFYRSDDVSAVAYFYLKTPVSNLPSLNDKQLRIEDMKEKVWKFKK